MESNKGFSNDMGFWHLLMSCWQQCDQHKQSIYKIVLWYDDYHFERLSWQNIGMIKLLMIIQHKQGVMLWIRTITGDLTCNHIMEPFLFSIFLIFLSLLSVIFNIFYLYYLFYCSYHSSFDMFYSYYLWSDSFPF